ncbi:fumarylacetoacetate hydrolase family protein [Niallia endozanthoxylica]|uniref:Fumarylacetoacetate hydrolase family protein n=1 Tax=Niallia endozanthoxylica TaxID=2036016 RepID=A0A5J5I5A4_9BACI|nr:fumarylacetoacetate hydrolase family protein [Niallia endozanthoxylica]KAA9031674.1 fumarylacetoacetate hydrolase family protein [Niallia endozanthoxylica]
MKIALFNENRVGVVDGSNVIDITELTAWNNEEPQASLVKLMGEFETLRPKIEAGLSSCPVYPVSDVALRAPVPNPSKIVAAPINYILHKQEMNTALTVDGLGFFLKSPSSIIGPDQTVLLPFRDRRVDHEAEIAFVVGKEAKDVKAEDASEYIFGYLALMDITVRGKEDRPWRKSFDTFTPIGPWIVTGDEVENPNQLQMNLWVNDEIRQSANTSDLIYDCYKFFEAASSVMTLLPGDIITTGTPEGVAPITKGDTVRIHIERIGEFSVQVDYKPGI